MNAFLAAGRPLFCRSIFLGRFEEVFECVAEGGRSECLLVGPPLAHSSPWTPGRMDGFLVLFVSRFARGARVSG